MIKVRHLRVIARLWFAFALLAAAYLIVAVRDVRAVSPTSETRPQ